MKSFLLACLVLIVIAVGAGLILSVVQQPSDQAFKTSDVRL